MSKESGRGGRRYLLVDFLAHIMHKIAGKVNQNEAGWSIQADFFADIPDVLFLGNQEAKTSERSENELEYFIRSHTQNNL